jgi:chromosome segregation ATPase
MDLNNDYDFTEIELVYNLAEETLTNINLYTAETKNLGKYIKDLFSFARVVYEDNNFLRNFFTGREDIIKQQNEEILNLNAKIIELENIIYQKDKYFDQRLRNHMEIQKVNFTDNLKILEIERNKNENENIVNELTQKLKVCDIEKEELNAKIEQLENELKKLTEKSRQLRNSLKDKDIEIIKSQNELIKVKAEKEEYNYHSTNYDTEAKNDDIILTDYKEKDSEATLLSNIFPDLENEHTSLQNDRNVNITLSSKSLNKLVSNTATNSLHGDIYKDFFMLTFQAIKINKRLNTIKINPNTLYKYILDNQIPFHKVTNIF